LGIAYLIYKKIFQILFERLFHGPKIAKEDVANAKYTSYATPIYKGFEYVSQKPSWEL